MVSTIDFRYLTDVITPDEALRMLEKAKEGKEERTRDLQANGYRAYTTQVGWLGYGDQLLKDLCKKYLDLGFNAFKIKVGRDLKDDLRRAKIIRGEIGTDNLLMMDANQVWDVNEAIEWMGYLAHFKPLWIEEPTSPDDVLGHAAIGREVRKMGIGVATGEMCCNRILFKQFLQSGAMDYCQVDSARIGGINEILAVYFMAKKLNVKVCPHAGGVGLCEMVQHLQMWDYVSLSCNKEGRYIEYVDQQHEQFLNPVIMENAHYMPPQAPGYNTELKAEAIEEFQYPNGTYWLNVD